MTFPEPGNHLNRWCAAGEHPRCVGYGTSAYTSLPVECPCQCHQPDLADEDGIECEVCGERDCEAHQVGMTWVEAAGGCMLGLATLILLGAGVWVVGKVIWRWFQ